MMAKPWQRIWARAAIGSLTIGALLSGVTPVPASAATTVGVAAAITADGTPEWEPSPDGNPNATDGYDAGASNGVVRVNDTVTYRFDYNANSTTTPATNVTITVEFPKGVYLSELPGQCKGAGSSLNPTTMPAPSLPISANALDSMPQQVLVCNLGTASDTNVSSEFSVTPKVSSLVPDATALQLQRVSIAADGVAEVQAPNLPSVTASARLKWDISKNSVALKEDSGYRYGPVAESCRWDASRVCLGTMYTALIYAPAGGKGAMPAIGDITFTDDLSPQALYGDRLTASQIATMNADLDKFGARVSIADGFYSAPAPSIGFRGSTEKNSVRNSGQVTVNQAGPGQVANFTVRGADTSLLTYPSQVMYPAGQALPSSNAYAVSVSFRVQVPVETVKEFGTYSSNTWTLRTKNSYTAFHTSGFAADDVQTITDQQQWNDYRTTSPVASIGVGFSKYFAAVPGSAGNMTASQFNPSDSAMGEGPPGGATFRSGGITVGEGQDVQTQILVVGTNPTLPGDVSFVACDAWDNTRLYLEQRNSPGTADNLPSRFQKIPSNGQAVWVSGYNNANVNGRPDWATRADQVPALTVEYSPTPGGSGASSECGDDTGPWYSSPDQVPGNDPDLAQRQVYTGVARVRVHGVLPAPVATSDVVGAGVRIMIGISHEVADTDHPAGDILPNWAAVKRVNLENLDMSQVLAYNTTWGRSGYVPQTHTGAAGDRLIKANSQVRVTKQVRKGTTGEFSDTPPRVIGSDGDTAGDTVQFKLAPSLTSGAQTPGVLQDVWLEDCLPISQEFVEASIAPDVIAKGYLPTDAKRAACDAGETYLRWVFQDHEVNQAMDEIIVTTTTSGSVVSGDYINDVVVWATDDQSPVAQRTDTAGVQVTNEARMKLEEVRLTPVVQVNDANQSSLEYNKWQIKLTNLMSAATAAAVQNPDIIVTLPRVGDGTSDFDGSFEFVSAVPVAGGTGTTRLLFTSASAINQDPNDPSNNSGAGAITWCDAPVGGNVVYGPGPCPTQAAEVTGMRILQPGAFGQGASLTVELTMVGKGNSDGDIYAVSSFARAEGLNLPVGPIVRTERAIAGEIGDYAWIDLNNDGIQDASEPPAEGVAVTLTGTDDLGNQVRLETVTASDGSYSFPALRASDAAGYVVTFGSYGGGFTQATAGSDEAVDSDADPVTGASAPVVLTAGQKIPTIDAGFIPAPGKLKITKQVSGEGVTPFADGDSFTFQVVCTHNQAEVINTEVTLTLASAATSGTVDVPGDIPVGAECRIEETGVGKSDPSATAPSAQVTIGWDAAAKRGQTLTASITNYYSAGIVKVSKELAGDAEAVANARGAEFLIEAICYAPANADNPDAVVLQRPVWIRGDQVTTVSDWRNDPIKVPLGARCYGIELYDGGAADNEVIPGSATEAEVVATADPNTLGEVTIEAVNTFLNPPDIEVTKELNNLTQNDGVIAATYTVTVANTGSLPTTYDLNDQLLFGTGVQIDNVDVAANGIVTNPAFDGVNDRLIVNDQEIVGKTTHTYTITVTAQAPFTITSQAADCTVDGGETGTGLLNRATVNWGIDIPPPPQSRARPDVTTNWGIETVQDEACEPVAIPSAPTGQLSVVKQLDGDPEAVQQAQSKRFAVEVTCELPQADGTKTLVHRGMVYLTGAQTQQVVGVDGNPISLPYGTQCYGVETYSSGASKQTIDHDETSPVVVGGTVTGEVSQLQITATNTFYNPAKITMAKEVAQVRQSGGQIQISYDITVTNSGTLPGRYELRDQLAFGEGVEITDVQVMNRPANAYVSPDFNGSDHPFLARSLYLPGGSTHTYTVIVTATAPFTLSQTAADCTLADGETGTGLRNVATLDPSIDNPPPQGRSVPLTETAGDADWIVDDACAAVDIPPAPTGELTVTKVLTGDAEAIAAQANTEFTVAVTCELPQSDGTSTEVFSGDVVLTGAESKKLVDDSGQVVSLPFGARCYGIETDDGGAQQAQVDHAPDNPVTVGGTRTGEVSQLTITATNRFDNPAQITMTKDLATVKQVGGEITANYTITVVNNGTQAGSYDLTDSLNYGPGVVVNDVAVSVDPSAVSLESTFNGADQTTIARGVAIPGGHTHRYTVTVKATAPFTMTQEAADCTLAQGESGTGLRNEATLHANGETTTDDACEPVTIPPAPTAELTIAKVLTGDAEAVAQAQTKQFTIQVTCELADADGNRSTVYQGDVVLSGEQSKKIVDADGNAVQIPYGAHCYGVETDNGGAVDSEVDYSSYDLAAVVGGTTTGQVSQLQITATNTFRNPAEVTMVKSLATVSQDAGEITASYTITVHNSGSQPGSYDLRDELKFGQGVSVNSVEVTSTSATPNAQFNGSSQQSIVEGQAIDGGQTHTYTVKVTAAAAFTTTAQAANCALEAGEDGTGLLNSATLTVGDSTLVDDACAPVVVPPAPTGELTLAKVLIGDPEAVAEAQNKEFTLHVTCELADASGQRTVVYSGDVVLTGEQSAAVVDSAGDPVTLPYQSRCYATETDAGGATESHVDYDSFDNAAIVTGSTTGDVSQLKITATNTFRNPSALEVTKELVSSSQVGQSVQASYRIQVTNKGSLEGSYDLRDQLALGAQVMVNEVKLTGVEPTDLAVNPNFNGLADQVLITGARIAGGATHSYTIEVTGTVNEGGTAAAADCTLAADETGTGLLNRAVMTTADTESLAEACAPVTPQHRPTPVPVKPGLPATGS